MTFRHMIGSSFLLVRIESTKGARPRLWLGGREYTGVENVPGAGVAATTVAMLLAGRHKSEPEVAGLFRAFATAPTPKFTTALVRHKSGGRPPSIREMAEDLHAIRVKSGR